MALMLYISSVCGVDEQYEEETKMSICCSRYAHVGYFLAVLALTRNCNQVVLFIDVFILVHYPEDVNCRYGNIKDSISVKLNVPSMFVEPIV